MAEEKKKEENKAPAWAWWTLIIMSAVIAMIFAKYSGDDTLEDKGDKATAQNWKLYWEKNPDATMDTSNMMPPEPVLAVIQRNYQSVTIAYKNSSKHGIMIGNSDDGISYDGSWKEKKEYGNFHLRFVDNNSSAVGWVDDKGEKPINLWLVRS